MTVGQFGGDRKRSGPVSLLLLSVLLGCETAESTALDSPPMDAGPLDGSEVPDAPPVAVPDDRLVVPLTVHVGRSALSPTDVERAIDGVNDIWLAPANVCFEATIVEDDLVDRRSLHLFLTAELIPGTELGTNGVYRGLTDIWTIDDPELSPAPEPYPISTSRTAAHELGHALGLGHQNCGRACPCESSSGLFCDDFLMRSGTLGYFVSPGEARTARSTAVAWGLPGGAACGVVAAP